jgi:mevalonate kinase
MGTTMSIDHNDDDATTGLNEDANARAHAHATMLSFEDKLRQESILIPEDTEDIHIQSEATATDTATADTETDATNNYGRGKHWKRNLKKKQQQQQQSTVVTHATERTIEQRREQVRPIVDKLTELQMNVSYPAIRELYKQISHFIKTGEDTKIKIAFPEFSRKIKGELSNAPYIPCWVKLEMD